MPPLFQHMNRPLPLNQVSVTILDDPQVNAANAGGGKFYVTTGLLQRASDDNLRGVLAHEIAHADLGHVAKQETLGIGLDLGAILLEQILPGSSVITPIAGQLLANAYSRSEESAADEHSVTILRRAGYDGKATMVNMLTWIAQTEGGEGGGGGFLSTHPATADRVRAIQRLP